jgi:hypothetical protein
MNHSDDFSELRWLFGRCNQTELYQIARRGGHVVAPNLSSAALIEIIIGAEEPPPVEHPVDIWRRAIMSFIIDHRRMLETQLTCPARTFREDACFGCVDAQVFTCVTSNGHENLRLIQLRLKKENT